MHKYDSDLKDRCNVTKTFQQYGGKRSRQAKTNIALIDSLARGVLRVVGRNAITFLWFVRLSIFLSWFQPQAHALTLTSFQKVTSSVDEFLELKWRISRPVNLLGLQQGRGTCNVVFHFNLYLLTKLLRRICAYFHICFLYFLKKWCIYIAGDVKQIKA